MSNIQQSMHSGEPGSSGRELFEGSTATGHGEKQPTFGAGYKEGTEAGDKGNHGEHESDLGAGPHRRTGSGGNQQTGANTGSGGIKGALSGLTGGQSSSTGHEHTGNTHSHSTSTGAGTGAGLTGGHSGSGTGNLTGKATDISSAVRVPHEEHALHGAGIQSIGGASVNMGAGTGAPGNHNPRSAAQGSHGQNITDQGIMHTGNNFGHSSSSHGASGQGVNHGQDVSRTQGISQGQGVSQGGQRETTRHGLTNQFDHSDDKLLANARREADTPTDGKINLDSANPSNLLNRAGDKANAKADQKAEENGMQSGGNLEDKARRAANK